jgi:Spx/MgsR family transcriptional regulator
LERDAATALLTGRALAFQLPAHPERTSTMAKPVMIYGIKNCDTMAKARAWLDDRRVAYAFHDYRAEGIERERLKEWADKVGWEKLVNRSSTTFRALAEKDKQGLSEMKAIALMAAQPTMIKRPVLDVGGALTVGFKPAGYEAIFPQR